MDFEKNQYLLRSTSNVSLDVTYSDAMTCCSDWLSPDEEDVVRPQVVVDYAAESAVVSKPITSLPSSMNLNISQGNSQLRKKAVAGANTLKSKPSKLGGTQGDKLTKKASVIKNKPISSIPPKILVTSQVNPRIPLKAVTSTNNLPSRPSKLGGTQGDKLTKKASVTKNGPISSVPSKILVTSQVNPRITLKTIKSVNNLPSRPSKLVVENNGSLTKTAAVTKNGPIPSLKIESESSNILKKVADVNVPPKKAKKLTKRVANIQHLPKAPLAVSPPVQYPAPRTYNEYDDMPHSFGEEPVIMGNYSSYEAFPQCDSFSVGADDFNVTSPDVFQKSLHGDRGDEIMKRKPFERFRGGRDVKNNTAKQSTVKRPCEKTRNEPFEYLWSVSDDAFKFSPVKRSKSIKENMIQSAYNAPPAAKLKHVVKKNGTRVGPPMSSSCINRQKLLKETEARNKSIASKVLSVKPTITAFKMPATQTKKDQKAGKKLIKKK